MAANMADVAALAGVSQRTVSNVVRGYVHVRPETRERVQAAIDQLRYRPNASARSLRAGRTGILALALPYIEVPYFAELANHVQQSAAERGFTLLMDQTDADPVRELLVLEGYRTHVIDGLIFSPMAMTGADLQGRHLDVPTVLLGERIRSGPLVNVAIDNVAAGREATAHLLAGGRRRIAAVGELTMLNTSAAHLRLRGYQLAHGDVGLEVAPELVRPTAAWALADGHAAVNALLAEGVDFDAMFCLSDDLALGALRALSEHGVAVPREVSVLGWDDIRQAQFAVPSLTSVAPDKSAIAAAAVDQLLAQVMGEQPETLEVVCSHRLVVRESTSPAAPHAAASTAAGPRRRTGPEPVAAPVAGGRPS